MSHAELQMEASGKQNPLIKTRSQRASRVHQDSHASCSSWFAFLLHQHCPFSSSQQTHYNQFAHPGKWCIIWQHPIKWRWDNRQGDGDEKQEGWRRLTLFWSTSLIISSRWTSERPNCSHACESSSIVMKPLPSLSKNANADTKLSSLSSLFMCNVAAKNSP